MIILLSLLLVSEIMHLAPLVIASFINFVPSNFFPFMATKIKSRLTSLLFEVIPETCKFKKRLFILPNSFSKKLLLDIISLKSIIL